MKKIVLLRHGESTWNKENRFTGWVDVGLSEKGMQEAAEAGRTLKKERYVFDVAYTSVLKRAIKTLWLALEEMDLMYLPVVNNWRLNERHYGALQGLNKAEMAEKHGMEKVQIWRRSYDVTPHAVTPDNHMDHGKGKSSIRARPDGQIRIGLVSQRDPFGINHNELRPFPHVLLDRRAQGKVRLIRVMTPQDVEIGIKLFRGIFAEGDLPSSDAHPVTNAFHGKKVG